MNTYDILVSDLCEQIDILKDSVAYWKGRYEEEQIAHNETLNNYSTSLNNSIGQMLTLALNSVPTPEGLLIKQSETTTP